MRLTLRTMLAYLDGVLEPADAAALRAKIDESEFASGLVQRIQAVLHKLRLDAPKLDGKGMGNDANTVSEYLDSALPQDRVGEFERVCLESDRHLCEVAACHQVLTIVLGKPADVPADLRERIYALADPDRAGSNVAVRGAPPVVAAVAVPESANANGRPAPRPAPLEVPEYLRAGRETSLWPWIGTVAAALLISLVVLRMFGPFNAQHPLAHLMPGRPAVPEVPASNDKTVAAPEEAKSEPAKGETTKTESPEPSGATPATATPTEAATAAATPTPADATASSTAVVERTPADSPDNKSGAPDKAGSPDRLVAPDNKPALDKVAIATPKTLPATLPASPILPDATPLASSPPPTPLPTASTPKMPTVKGPVVAAPAKPPMDVGRYTSDGQLFATLDATDGLWYVKQPPEVLTAGERLVVLPPYRPQIALPSAVQLTFAGEGSLQVVEPDELGIPRVAIEYGRFMAVTAGKSGAQVALDLVGIQGVLTLTDADSMVAIKAIRWIPPGTDPELMPGIPVIEMYNANGRAAWQQNGHAKVEIPAQHVHVYIGDEAPETHGPFLAPDWTDSRSVKPIDRDASVLLERLVDNERPLNLSLQETMKDRRVEVRALTARCLAALGEFESILRELSDPNQYSFWPSEFEVLRQAVQRSPETAGKIRETLSLARADDAKDLYRLLWGYSEEQLARDAATQLVRSLESEQMDVRVLSYLNLVSITGASGFYRPERSPAQTKTAIQGWKDRLNKGTITYRFPPSPLDSYKPLMPPGVTAPGGASK